MPICCPNLNFPTQFHLPQPWNYSASGRSLGIFNSNFASNLPNYQSSRSQTISCTTAQAQDYSDTLQFESMDSSKYSKELEVGVKAVHMACLLCQTVQNALLSNTNHNHHIQSKDDHSPVTIAGIYHFLFSSFSLKMECCLEIASGPKGVTYSRLNLLDCLSD